MHQRILLFLTMVLFAAGTSVSSQKILDFNQLNIDDGFTSSRANVITQDRKGFIWIGTWNGLNRYDGYETEVFKPQYHDTTTVSNREVLALLEDHAGDMWIGTTSGLNRYNPQTRTFKRYPFQNRILSLLEDSDHNIWIGTNGGGLHLLNPATGHREHYLGSEVINDVHEDSRRIFWVATNSGLINFDRNNKSYYRFRSGSDPFSISHNQVTQIVESEDKNLWIGTWGGGLNKMIYHDNKDSVKFYCYNHFRGNKSISSNVIFKLYYDAFGNLWIGTWNDGLALMEPSEQKKSPATAVFQTFKNDPGDQYSISGNNITSIFVDRSGVLWVGAANIDRTSIIKTGITRYKTSRMQEGVLSENFVSSLLEEGNKLWVGTTDELQLYQFSNGKYNLKKGINRPSYTYKNQQYFSYGVHALAKNHQGLWLGTNEAGLILYPGNSAETQHNPAFKFFNAQTDPALPGNKIGNVITSQKTPGVLWVGTAQSGFSKLSYNGRNARIQIWYQGEYNTSISDNNIRAVLEDKDGMVWIGTQNGLNRLDPATGFVEQYYFCVKDTATINDNVINTLFEDSKGNLWIGTNAGLNKKMVRPEGRGKGKVFFKGYPNVEDLDDEIISNIIEDDSGNIWLGLYLSLIKFNIEKDSLVKEYFTKDYQRVITSRNNGIKVSNGGFVLGGTKGFITVDPDRLLLNSRPPEVRITDIFVYNESLTDPRTAEKYNIETAVPYSKTLHLSYKDKIVRFVFSAMDFKDPKKNTYSYYLEGFDDMWNDAGTRNSATYTNINFGEYTFKVKATNSDGIESTEPFELRVSIAAPWWATKWAIIVFLIVFIGLLYFFKQYSIIEVRQKGRIMLEHVQFEKEHELTELKSRFFTNITHEFRTPLTLIQGPSEELLKMDDISPKAKKQASLIQRNAQRLLRLINQLMEFRKIEQDKMSVFPQKTDVKAIMKDLFDTFKSMADSKNIEFRLDVEGDELCAEVDIDKFEKILYNLVSNAFKYTENDGIITLRAFKENTEIDERSLVLEIEDTGIGIEKKHQEKVFEKFFQTGTGQTQSTGGIGLFLVKALVELHGGKIQLDSEPGKGSCFRAIFPRKVKTIDGEAKVETDSETLENAIPKDSRGQDQLAKDTSLPTVLIVEDDEEMNDFIVSGLSDEFNVFGAENGKDGLEKARKIDPDLIISDIMMPEVDGIEMMKLLRKELTTSHIPVVFLTAKTMREDEIEGLKLGAVDYIYKPFNLISLKLKIHNILDNRQKIRNKIRADQLLEPEKIELTSLDEKFLKEAVKAVNDNLDDTSFDVEKFSMVLGVSPNKVYRKIKALTGQTAKEFIRNQRLKTAANLFLQNKRSISEIIYMVGFSSPSYFTRCFREYYGCTPKEYIEKGGQI